MNIASKVVTTSAKSALLATLLLIIYLLVFEGGFFNAIPIVLFLGYIITFLISLGMIITTLLPFYSFSKSNDTQKIFKIYFPYYAVFLFLFLVTFTVFKDSIIDDLIFIPVITFITAMQAWVWFFKVKKNDKNKV